MQLHELGNALKASDIALERVRGERDVLGDEMALLQTRMRMLEKDEMERIAEVEEEEGHKGRAMDSNWRAGIHRNQKMES